jgi:curved DNA-binding protein CbpA
VLPDATESEIRVAYRRQARVSHPDLNRQDPEAAARMKRINLAARVLLDASLRRAYDRAPRHTARSSPPPPPPRTPAWYERGEQRGGDSWAPPPRESAAPHRSRFGNFMRELRGSTGHRSLQLQELVEALSVRQQLSVAALLFAVALGLLAMANPKNLGGDEPRPTGIDASALYP